MTAIPKGKRVSLSQVNNQRLLELAAEGSEKAFRQIVVEQQQSVRIFLSRYVHCSQQVDDLAQDVFIAAFNQLQQFRHESKLSTWLLGIARNKALSFLRAELRRRERRAEIADSNRDMLLQKSLEAIRSESDATRNEIRLNALQDCLQKLPQPAQHLIERFYFNSENAQTIATENRQKPGALRMKLKRIRHVLHKCISEKLNHA